MARRKTPLIEHVRAYPGSKERWWLDHNGDAWLNVDLLREAPLTDAEVEEMRRQAFQIRPGPIN